jgi:hypothetical protein
MSTLWTPDGERPVRHSDPATPSQASAAPPVGADGEPSDEEMAAQMAEMAELAEQLATTPAELVIANHAYGLFQLASLHLSLQPPQLDQARLAIDACGALVEGLRGRLGEPEEQLVEGLAQLRLAFVQISGAIQAQGGPAPES